MSLFSLSPFPLSRASLALLLAAVTLRAQNPSAPELTLAQALARAGERHPGLAAQGYQERAADALIEQAGLRPNPTLQLETENFFGTGALQGVRRSETTVQASQTFERGGKREKRVAVARRERETAASELAVRRAEILGATATAFVHALAAQQRLTLAAEPLRLAREIADTAERRMKAGAASLGESARGRLAIASAQAELARAQSELQVSRARLAAMWGGSAAEISALSGTLQEPDALPLESEFAAKLGGHPRLAHQKAIIASRRAALELEQSHATQDLTVGGGVRFLREGSDAGFVAGVSMPLPVRNKNQGNIRAARETLGGAEQVLRAIENELRTSLASAWQELAAAHAAVQTLRRDALPATEDAHALVRRAYAEGQLPLIDVLDAQRTLISVRREIFDAAASYAAAHARAEAIADPSFSSTAALLSSR
jgi:cobalt-zinc-cadmium efflux system outer membrane protein